MEKNKNRTDLLAAGRKKLQQFRKNKDQKGTSSSHGKSSGKAKKPENEDDPVEPSKIPETHLAIDADGPGTDQSDPSVFAEPLDPPFVPSDKRYSEEFTPISLDHQGANLLGSQEGDVEGLENRKDDNDGSIPDMAADSERKIEDLAAVSSSGLEVVQENERDRGQVSREEHKIDRGGINGETPEISLEATPSFLAEELQEASGNSYDERTSREEKSEVLPTSQDVLSVNGADYLVVVDGEGERRNNEDLTILISGNVRPQEENGSSILAEESKVENSDRAEGITPAEESSAGPLSSHDSLAAEGEDDAVAADQEGERKYDEYTISQSWRIQEANKPLIPDKVLMEEETILSYTSEESNTEETSENILSFSQGIQPSEGRDGAALPDEEGGRIIQEANWSFISGEVHHEANTSILNEPDETSYIGENLEIVASSGEDTAATMVEDVAAIADTGEETRVVEGNVLRSSLGEDATVEYIEKLPERGVISFGEMAEGINKEDSQVCSLNSEVESLKQLLYQTIIEKDVLQLQLDEQTALNADNQRHSFDEVSKLSDLVMESQDGKAVVYKELEQCRHALQGMTIAKEELEARCLSTKGQMEELQNRASGFQNKLERSQEEVALILAELADCRVSLETLQKENFELKQSLISEKDATTKLMEEKEFFSSENNKFASEVVEQKHQLIIALDKQVELQSNLRDTVACFDHLTEENLYLASSLEVHKAKIKELNQRHLHLPSEARESFGNEERIYFLPKDVEEDHVNSNLFRVLKQCLDEANNILHNLEKSVDGMYSQIVSFSRSGGRAAAPGISKLIQAFESKAHHERSVSDEIPPLIEGGYPEGLYTSTKEQTCSLRDILKQMDLRLRKAEIYLTKEQNSKEYSSKFGMEFETQNEENSFFQERIDELVKEVSGYQSKIVDLQNIIDEMQQNANEESARLLTQVEMLQKEVDDRVAIFKQEEDSIRGVVLDAIEKLSDSIGMQVGDGLDVGIHIMASADAAVLAIKSLHEQLEAAHLNYTTLQTSFEELNKSFVHMQGRNELAIQLLKKLYGSLGELVSDSYQGEFLLHADTDEFLQFLLHRSCDLLIKHLQKLIDEHRHLLSMNNELEAGLSNRNQEFEELNVRYDALSEKLEDENRNKGGLESILANRGRSLEEVANRVAALAQKFEGDESSYDLDSVSMLTKPDNEESNFCNPMFLRLEALVASHLKRHEEAIEQINSSKIYLREVDLVTEISADSWSVPLHTFLRQDIIPKMSELKEKLQLLGASNFQQETEIQLLKEDLSKMEEALIASCSELNLKVSELEQSELRLSSVREKLSIAVAKGKGLVVQRDSLKQSLMEKSSELEKCLEELQSKETLLREVEAKLKSCSEVDRVEALESELSYIRNSATALRDSFLLKDSVLQRIEEVLEDLDLPENFHSKDIVEKIELLSRFSGKSSFPVTDWDQKSSEGRSHSDSGFVVMDGWKDEPSSNQEFDELKRKYEELQSKFYGLAEHNDMLEQSLMERNSLVQKWEEMLDRIDMPSHLRTLEPEDRLESLARELSELQQERDSLLLKIENLEDSSDMLVVDVEESHKKISELSAEAVAVKYEKDFFSESLDKLRFQYLSLSEKADHDEVERENLQRELADLQGKLAEKVENTSHCDIEYEMQKLHDLVLNALPDSDKPEAVSDVSSIAFLEALISKLINIHTDLSLDKSENIIGCNRAPPEERNLSLDKQSSRDLHDRDQEITALRLELDEASQTLVLVKEERDAAMEKCHSLTLEMEELTRQMNSFQEERIHDMEKYQTLKSELESLSEHRDALQEQLTQEEQKSSAAREKLNVAVRKGKGLVQQRDALKQTIEEMNTKVEHLKVEHNQRVETLESAKSLLMSQLAECNQNLHECSQNLSRLLTAVHPINIGSEVNIADPVLKLEEVGKFICDLHSAAVSSEHEAKKSKQASELLLVELNEVQDRVDALQEDLEKAEAELAESYRQKQDAEAAKIDALSHLEQFMSDYSEERKKEIDSLVELKSGIDQLRKGCNGFTIFLYDAFRKEADLFSFVQPFLQSILIQTNGENVADLPVLGSSNLPFINPLSEEDSYAAGDVSRFGDNSMAEHLAHACYNLQECKSKYDILKENVNQSLSSIDQQETYLSEALETVKRKLVSQKEYSESLKREVARLESVIMENEAEIFATRRNVSLLYKACRCSIVEIESKKTQVIESSSVPEEHVSGKSTSSMTLPDYIGAEESADDNASYTDQSIRTMADSLILCIQRSTNESQEGSQRELKSTILDLQRELQEKDIEMKRISEELVSQIRDAEAVSERSLTELDSARALVLSLEKKVVEMENDKQILESRINELKDSEASSQALQVRVEALTDLVAAKDQEIEGLRSGLMQALDEEESKMEALENRNLELEDILQEKILALEKLEASQAKAMAKLSTTVNKFDELHDLSENLLAEIESLQSQVQERDSEISFFRQEVTRCTNNDLASQETNKKYLSEINEVLKWMQMMASRYGEPHIHNDDQSCSQIHIYTEILDKRMASVMNELEDLRVTTQSTDELLQVERNKVEELLRKTADLETLHVTEIQREPFQGESDSVRPSSSSSPGHLEIEQMVQRNKASSAPIVTHIRSGRKVNNDQVAIAIDMEKDNVVLDDDDDDKAHGFKALTMSRIVPRATRPISDRIDAIWVSAERLLMRQPSLRLGVILYWALLHALLASII